MRDDEVASSMLFRLGQEFKRAESDGCTTRDNFWGNIEERFSDDSACGHFSLQGHVDEADRSGHPLRYCCADMLKGHFRHAKALFTTALSK